MKPFFTILISLLVFQLYGQKMLMFSGGGPEPLIIEEIGLIATEDSGVVKVMAALPHKPDGSEVQKTDIKKDDIILMVNGERIKSIDRLKEIYKITSVNDQVKIGLERSGKMFLSSFRKEKFDENGNKKQMVMKMNPEEGKNITPWMATGYLLGEKDGKVKIINIMPGIPAPVKLDGIEKDDIIQSINQTAVQTVEKFMQIYDAAPVGDQVTIQFVQSGKTIERSFKKPEFKGKMIMNKN